MKWRNALHAAREQIVWIIALVGSTAIVVQLERLELELPRKTLTANPFVATPAETMIILDQIRAQNDESDLALAQLGTALAMGLMLESTTEELRNEAMQVLFEAQERMTKSDEPTLHSAATLLSHALKRFGENLNHGIPFRP